MLLSFLYTPGTLQYAGYEWNAALNELELLAQGTENTTLIYSNQKGTYWFTCLERPGQWCLLGFEANTMSALVFSQLS